jgi:pimeloyl-ACP methyl ester carboxylesterase
MPSVRTTDGVELHYTECGQGTPLVFVHEFAGDGRSWEPQLRHFGRHYRCVAYNARGYPPSGVPMVPASYSQAHAADDLAAIIERLGLAPAHVVGLSMGAFATLHLGLRHPHLARSLTLAGIGYGAAPGAREPFQAEIDASVAGLRSGGMARFAEAYAHGPTRLVFKEKDPRGFAEFASRLAEHSGEGAALTMLGVQRERPALHDLESGLRRLALPTLIMTGDEDDPTLEPSLYLKRSIASAALMVMPRCGHTLNLEEPEAFNRAVRDFIGTVDAGAWRGRIPGSLGGAIIRS